MQFFNERFGKVLMINYNFCPGCFSLIETLPSGFIQSYLSVCKNLKYFDKFSTVVDLNDEENSNIKFLECFGFIVSTECSEKHILVRPKGFFSKNHTCFTFCSEETPHD